MGSIDERELQAHVIVNLWLSVPLIEQAKCSPNIYHITRLVDGLNTDTGVTGIASSFHYKHCKSGKVVAEV
jgi:hypothetical protein